MRFLTLFDDYLRGTRDYSAWSHIYDLLMRIDSCNDCINELEFRGRLSKETGYPISTLTWFSPCYPRWIQYGHLGWLENLVRSYKGELKREYGIGVDAFMEISEEQEEIIDGQISIDDYVYSLNPVFRMSRPDLIEVHP